MLIGFKNRQQLPKVNKTKTMSGSVRRSTNKSVRPLGAIRQPILSFERVGRIPQNNYNKNMSLDYELQGNAMQVCVSSKI